MTKPTQTDLVSFAICFDSAIIINDVSESSELSGYFQQERKLITAKYNNEKVRLVTHLVDGSRKKIIHMRKVDYDRTELKCQNFRDKLT